MDATICLPKDEYDFLKMKADLFDKYVETEELSKDELAQVKKALKEPFLSKAEFLRRHQDFN